MVKHFDRAVLGEIYWDSSWSLALFFFFLVPCLLSCGAVPLARHLHAGVYECGRCYLLLFGSHQYGRVPLALLYCDECISSEGGDLERLSVLIR